MVTQYYSSITQRLEDLGWAEDLASIRLPDSLANHKLVDRPQLLTERSEFWGFKAVISTLNFF